MLVNFIPILAKVGCTFSSTGCRSCPFSECTGDKLIGGAVPKLKYPNSGKLQDPPLTPPIEPMPSFLFRQSPPKTYAKMMNRMCGTQANWDPPAKLRVSSVSPGQLNVETFIFTISSEQAGDFGMMKKQTGQLIVEGNIYEHKAIREVAVAYQAVRTLAIEYMEAHSYGVRSLDLGLGVKSNK